MFDILFARTFAIVWVMLLITAYTAYMNKNPKNSWRWTFIVVIILLFAIMYFEEVYPINLVLVWIFAAAMWWMISPTIKSMGENSKVKKFFKERNLILEKWQELNTTQIRDLEEYLEENKSNEEWNKIIWQAILSTALSVFATAILVFLSDIDFSFMWMFLFVALLLLIVMSLLNRFLFRSRLVHLIKTYFWVLLFTLYLIYDFNQLEKYAWDESWWTAINIAVNLYLDIINLFLYLLQLLSD